MSTAMAVAMRALVTAVTPEGSFLLAEVDGKLVAPVSLDNDDDEPLSDPSGPRPTFASYSGCRLLTFGGIATPSLPGKQRQSAIFEEPA
jgi:hypothetical protein